MSPERDRHRGHSRKVPFATAAIVAMLCGQAWAGEGPAEPESDGFWNTVLEKLDLRTKVGPMPDFVRKTHPDPSTLHFIPTSEPHPKRAVPVKPTAAIEAAKQALDAARNKQLNPPAPAAPRALPPPPTPGPPTAPVSAPAKVPAEAKQRADQN